MKEVFTIKIQRVLRRAYAELPALFLTAVPLGDDGAKRVFTRGWLHGASVDVTDFRSEAEWHSVIALIADHAWPQLGIASLGEVSHTLHG